MNIVQRMAEINRRKAELRAQLEGSENIDLDAIEAELRTLDEEYKNLEKRQQTINGINDGSVPVNIVANSVAARSADNFDQDKEYRNAWLKTLMLETTVSELRQTVESLTLSYTNKTTGGINL